MHAELNLTEIVLLVLFALIGGIGFSKLKQPPILGYILCGLILGPSGLKWIASRDQVGILSELGIIFLMFVIGFELRLSYIKNVWKIAVGTAMLQILSSLLIAFILSFFFSWTTPFVLLVGFMGGLSSTSAVIKILETLDETHSENGQRSIAILIAQDLAIVPMILILENSQYGQFNSLVILKVLLLLIFIGSVIFFLSRHEGGIHLPFSRIVFRDKELVTLASFALCVAAAWISGSLGLSEAFGAFLAGLILANTEQQKLLLTTIKPIQTLLLMVFFFSVGSFIDISYVFSHFWIFLFLLFIVTIGKSIMNIAILHIFKLSWSDAFFIGILLAQIGEFSFLLVKTGRKLKFLLNEEEIQLISLAVLSLSFSPVWIRIGKKLKVLTHVNIVSLRTLIEFIMGHRVMSFVGGFFKREKKISGIRLRAQPQLKLEPLVKKDEDNR